MRLSQRTSTTWLLRQRVARAYSSKTCSTPLSWAPRPANSCRNWSPSHRCRLFTLPSVHRQLRWSRTQRALVQVIGARLPKAIQQRQERKAAYAASSKEASKWMPLVQANRQAPTLRLTADDAATTTTTAAGLASKHTPVSDFEQEIADMLKAAGHSNAASAAQVRGRLPSSRFQQPTPTPQRRDASARHPFRIQIP